MLLVFFKKLIDLILYSNLWIACCAWAMYEVTRIAWGGRMAWDELGGFIFCSTLFLYAIHRIIGIRKVREYLDQERFSVISTYRSHIIFYGAIAGVGSLYFFLQLEWSLQVFIVLPALISVGYAVPLLGGKTRLRDLHFLKIFLIAIVWAWVTVLLPAVQEDQLGQWATWAMSLERSLFIFAITLPFDIRDLKVDKRSNVKTIPHFLGVKGSVYLGIASTILALFTALALYQLSIYSLLFFIGLSLSYVITALVIFYSQKVRHDYYFSGLTDGLMLIQLLAVWIIFL